MARDGHSSARPHYVDVVSVTSSSVGRSMAARPPTPTRETRVLRLFGDVEEDTKEEASSDRSPLETTTDRDDEDEDDDAVAVADDDDADDDDADDGDADDDDADDDATPIVEEKREDDEVRDEDAVDVDADDAGARDASSERVRFGASIAQLYRYKNDEYVPVGPAGLAILDRAGAQARDVLIYSPEKQPLVRRAIDERLTCEPQRDNYVTIRHDGAILFSALMRDESDWLAVAAQITIGHFVAARKRHSSGDDETPLSRFALDIASSETSSSVVEMGDSVQINFESIQGGVSTADDDVLSVALRDDTSRRVDGVKARLEEGDARALPPGLMEGLLGLHKDGRRLILHSRSETEFTLYDVTVLRMKKASKETTSKASAATTSDERNDEPREARADDEVERASTTQSESEERTRRSDQCGPSENTAVHGTAPFAPTAAGTPPPPRWYNQPVITAPAVPFPLQHFPLSPNDQSLMVDVKRAVDSLTEEMAALADKSRVGGAWIPPTPRGETKRAIEKLKKARREAMLPHIDVDAMSLADIKQLTVEAERVADMHEELRDYRRAAKNSAKDDAPPSEATDDEIVV